MSQPPSWSPDSLMGAAVEISALQLVERARDGRYMGGERWMERREGVKGKDKGKKGRGEGKDGRKRSRRTEVGERKLMKKERTGREEG